MFINLNPQILSVNLLQVFCKYVQAQCLTGNDSVHFDTSSMV